MGVQVWASERLYITVTERGGRSPVRRIRTDEESKERQVVPRVRFKRRDIARQLGRRDRRTRMTSD
jgi:hypothetical protein